MSSLLYALGKLCYRRWLAVFAAWLLTLVVVGLGALFLGNGPKDVFRIPGAESMDAFTTLQHTFPEIAGANGQMLVVAKDGGRPATAYAIPRALPPAKKDLPRIAVIIGGVGISAAGTADAAGMLPAPVTFALSPYGADLMKLADQARGEGHELLL